MSKLKENRANSFINDDERVFRTFSGHRYVNPNKLLTNKKIQDILKKTAKISTRNSRSS